MRETSLSLSILLSLGRNWEPRPSVTWKKWVMKALLPWHQPGVLLSSCPPQPTCWGEVVFHLHAGAASTSCKGTDFPDSQIFLHHSYRSPLKCRSGKLSSWTMPIVWCDVWCDVHNEWPQGRSLDPNFIWVMGVLGSMELYFTFFLISGIFQLKNRYTLLLKLGKRLYTLKNTHKMVGIFWIRMSWFLRWCKWGPLSS